MGNFDGTRFSGSPYYNDYNEAKNFLSVLFRPGVAVQARELTQLQTILQNQINRFGNNIFRDGSVVSGGQAAANNCKYFRVDPTLVNTNGVSAYLGKLIALADITNTAKVLHIESPTTTDPFYVFFIEYQTGLSDADGGWSAGTSFQVVDTGLTGLAATPGGSIPFKGDAVLVTVTDGIWYVDGYFVLASQQTTAAFEPGTSLTGRVFDGTFCKIGYQVVRSVVTPSEDSSLNDPSYGSYNYAAPGSDRYKIALDLVTLPFTQTSTGDVLYAGFTDTDFVEVTRVVDGTLIKTRIDSVYANLEKTLARRTYDESGSYTVRDFGLSIVEHYKSKLANGTVESTDEFGDYLFGVYTPSRGGDKSKLVYAVEPGKAYINGYEFETYQKSFLAVDKARTTDRVEGLNIVPNFGTYVDVTKIVGANSLTTSYAFLNMPAAGVGMTTLLNIDKAPIVTLIGDTTTTALATTSFPALDATNVIGYARLRFVQNIDSATARVYLGDIVVFNGRSLLNTKHILTGVPPFGSSLPTFAGGSTVAAIATGGTFTTKAFAGNGTGGASSGIANMPTTNGGCVFTDTNKNSLVFNLPMSGTVPKTVLSYDSVVYKAFALTGVSNAGAPLSTQEIQLASTGSTTLRFRDDAAKHIVIDTNGTVLSSVPVGNKVSYTVRTNNSSGGTDEGRMWIKITKGADALAAGNYVVIACLDANTANTTTYRTKTVSATFIGTLTRDATNFRWYLTTPLAEPVFDVFSYKKVWKDTIGPGGTDVTDKFTFQNNVTNSAYNTAYFVPIASYEAESIDGTFLVEEVRKFDRSGSFGPFLVNSYSTVNYSKIPAGNTTLVDYRPDIDNRPSNVAYQSTSSSNGLPGRGESFNITYDYYLSRIDKVILTANRTFEVIKGTPALTPSIPADKSDAMTLFTVGVNAYTTSPKDTTFTVTDNRRYTMRDIGALESRINRIEYATTLSQLEIQSQSLDIVDTAGATRFKTGILTDTFNTFGIADVSNRQFNCSLAFSDGTLRPRFIDRNVKLARSTSQPGSSLRAPTSDGIVTLDYTTDILLSQPFASQAISVNPYNVVSWVGSASSVPASDVWTDTQARPDIVVNSNAENDAAEAMVNAQGTSWGSWQTTWTGQTRQRISGVFSGWDAFGRVRAVNNLSVPFGTVLADGSVYTRPSESNFVAEGNEGGGLALRRVTNTVTQRRTGTRLVNNPTVVTTVLGTRVVDVSLAFFMRAKNVVVTAQGLKPLTKLYSFFDNQSVQDDVYSVIDANISTVSQGSGVTPTVVSITIPEPYRALMSAKCVNAGDGTTVKKTVQARVVIPYVTATQYSANPDATLKLLASDRAIAADENDLLGLNYADLQTSGTASVGLAVWKPNLVNPGGAGVPTVVGAGSVLESSTYNTGTGVLTLRGDWNFFTGFTTGVLNTVTPIKLLLSGIQTSDATGFNKFMFAIPRNTFRTGGRLFRLTDSSTNTARSSTTSAECTYRAQGTIQTTESTVISIRTPNVTRQDVTEEQTNSTSITQFFVAQDPLAQTFFVDSLQYPNGVYLPSVKLCFRSKDSNIPVKVQIRTTVNGYPHSYEVLPFAEKMLYPSEVNTTETPSFDAGFTEFAFSTPVFLPPGEYALVVMSNSNAYYSWIAEIGAKKWGTEERITEQPATGSLFKSQNATTWSAEQSQDLMFELNKCVFTSQVQASTFSNVVEPIGNKPSNDLTPSNNADLSTNTEVYYSLANVISQDTAPQGTTITYKIATKDKDSNILGSLSEVIPGENYQFTNEQVLRLYTNTVPAIAASRDDLVMSVEMSTDDPNVSPCLDTERLSAILVENYINNDTHDIATARSAGPTFLSTDNKELLAESKNIGIELLPGAIDPNAATITHPKPTARYMTRVTTLQPGYESDGVAVFLTANKPSGTQIEVYGKFKFTDDSSVNNFDDLPWYRIPVAALAKSVTTTEFAANVGTETNTSGDEFVEFKYELKAGVKPSGSETTTKALNPFYSVHGTPTVSPRKFSAYAIKICLFSSSPSSVPIVQDFRSISHI